VTNIILILGIAAILIIGTITADPFVFADKDKKDHKTLDEICAKKQHKNNFKGLFCQYLIELKAALESLQEHLDADKDLDDTNELQTLALEGSTLSISGLESSVELPTGSGGTTDVLVLTLKLSPQLTQPLDLDCKAETAGTIYYQEIPGQTGQMCACIDTSGDGEYGYQDLFSDSLC